MSSTRAFWKNGDRAQETRRRYSGTDELSR